MAATRKILVALAAFVAAMLVAAPVFGHQSRNGPHNENFDSQHDLYKPQSSWWDGGFQAAWNNYMPAETDGLNNAPLPDVVGNIGAADVEVTHQPCDPNDGNSESFFMHRRNGADFISVGECVTRPKWVTTHELQHSYGFPHPGEDGCANIEPDPEYLPDIRRSILCRARWESGDLPRHDKADLRIIPNKWQGDPDTFSASSAEGVKVNPVTTEAEYDSYVPERLQHVPLSEGDYIITE
jgi:hypothetical protein